MDSHFITSLTCPICLELAENALETSCCHQVFCEGCIYPVPRKCCPKCCQPFELQVSYITRQLVSTMPCDCIYPGCSVRMAQSELQQHQKVCMYRLYKCPAANCVYEGIRDNFAVHIARQHQESLVRNAELVLTKSRQELDGETNLNSDRISTRVNSKGNMCRLGSSGKYYCGQTLDGPRCSCCNGSCGPTNGCNCSSCMKLDVIARKLPKNWFVNSEGAVSRISTETGNMYCGRKVMDSDRHCDGYCGPTNGPNCMACKNLKTLLPLRYQSVWM